MIRSVVAAALCAVSMPVALDGALNPANADTPGCVTKREYHKVETGIDSDMTAGQVRHIFDTYGEQTYQSGWEGPSKNYKDQQRRYDACTSDRGYVLVAFTRERGGPWISNWKLANWDGK